MATIFISYARVDREVVERLREELTRGEHDVWLDVTQLPDASLFREEIALAIDRRDIFLFAVSEHSLRSRECRKEFEHARDRGKRIIPVAIDDTEPAAAPPDLADINWIRLADQRAIERIRTAIETDPVHLRLHTRFLINARDGTLLRGATLREAERWLAAAEGKKEPAPTDEHRKLVAASRRAETRRRFMIAAAVLAFVATIAILVIIAGQRAQSRRASLANRLAGESAALWNTHRFDESLLRAVAAYQAAPTSSALRALLNAAQGQPELAVILHTNQRNAEAVAFDPRGGRLVSGGDGGAAHIFDTTTWKPLGTFAAGSDQISQLTFAGDGSFLVSGGWDGIIRRWDVVTRKEIGTALVARRGLVEVLALHPNKRFLVAGYSNGALLWDLGATPPAFTELPLTGSRRINAAVFADDGATLVVDEGRGPLIAWIFANGVLLNRREQAIEGDVTALAAHGDTIVAGTADGKIEWLRARDLSSVRRTEAGEFVYSFAFDGERLAAAGSTAVRVWASDGTTPLATFPIRERIFAIAFEPGTSRVAVAGEEPRIYVLDLAERQPLAEVAHRVRASIQDIAFDVDGKSVIFTTLDDDRFRLDSVSRERHEMSPVQRSDGVTAVAEGPNGSVTGHKDGSVRVSHGSGTTILTGAKLELVMSVAFNPKGDLLVAGDNDGNLAAWDAKSLKFFGAWKTAGTAVAGLAFSPDGRRLAIVDAGTARITIMDFPEGKLTSFDGECQRSFSAAFRKDGQTLVTGCNDGSLELLDVVTRERLGSIPDNEDPPDPDFVNALARHPREDRFAAGTEDGRIMLWQLEPAYWIRRACRRANRDLAEVAGWVGDPLVPCSTLLKGAPADTHQPDVERDENEGPRVPINIALFHALRARIP